MNFSTTAHGKWILAGEHAVIRGCPALVFPVLGQSMNFEYVKSNQLLEVHTEGQNSEDLKSFFSVLVSKGLEVAKKSITDLQGKVIIRNNIPLGAGLGASAAICVSIARWFVSMGWLSEEEVFEFSKVLETIPHGESSGVDIATMIAGRGISFQRTGEWSPIEVQWKPHFYLIYSGHQGLTAKCVNHVKALIQDDPEKGQQIDDEMKEAVEMARIALSTNEEEGFEILKNSIDKAHSCFERWQLIDDEMKEKMDWLKANGAVAVKPVGSGGGGFLLGLWKTPPKEEIAKKLIACN